MSSYKIFSTNTDTNESFYLTTLEAKNGLDALKQAITIFGKSWQYFLQVEKAD